MSPHALVVPHETHRVPDLPTPTTTERATALMTALTSPTPLTSTSTVLDRLDRFTDDAAVDSLLRSFLARRRALRQARRQLALEQVRHEHELLMQRALLSTGLAHLR